MAKLLDANAILRFLLNDIPEQAEDASQVIYNGAFTKEAVVAEVIYVLQGVYRFERREISGKMLSLLELVEIENLTVVNYALKMFGEHSFDFVDCLLIAYNNVMNVEVFSFDKKLNKRLV